MNHKDLNVWKESMKLVKDVYVVLKKFLSDELFGLCSQMKRSSVSIPSNIAEGAGRNNDKENLELETQLLLSADLNYLKPDHPLFKQITTVQKLLSGYIRHLQLKIRSPK